MAKKISRKKMLTTGYMLLLIGLLPILMATSAIAEDKGPVIALIIDDMGYNQQRGLRALNLPGAVTFAFLPHTPYGIELAETAHKMQKQVMLHLPMQPRNETADDRGLLTVGMSEREFRRTLLSNIASIPHVVGVNNHRGSLLTRETESMEWLMQGLRAFGLYFIDSRTTVRSVAEDIAKQNLVPTAGRNVFLDHEIDEDMIKLQFDKLVRYAIKHGRAIGIGHPHPETLNVLVRELPRLKKLGIRIVPALELTQLDIRRPALWQASSSPLPKVAKSSKPLP